MVSFTSLQLFRLERSLPFFTTYLLMVAFALIGYGAKADSTQSIQNAEKVANNIKQNSKQTEIRVGYQKGTAYLNILKARGSLEKQLNPKGVGVRWIEFTQGPPMMEAMNAGAVDIGVVGAPPPIFAQAAGVPITYVASSFPSGKSQVILVKKNSAIRTVADLKGKKVAVGKGTAGHYLIVKVLEAAKLTLKDIQPVYLLPPEARSAFEGGNVDAWVTSDPRYAEAERTGTVRLLATGEKVAEQRSYFIATRSFVNKYPNFVKTIVDEQKKDEQWAKSNKKETARILETATGVKAENWEWTFQRRPNFGVIYMNDQIVKEQQQMADLFFNLKLIPKAVQVKEVVWKP
ncbi:sulfonate ABC transporter substrate-binding protein [Scytonema sp. NUACC26]